MEQPTAPRPRSTGVLLHPTALPGSPVCGSFGEPCRRWVHQLADNNIGVWQILPLAPPDPTGSPYSSPSCFALNPWLLDAADLTAEGYISSDDQATLPAWRGATRGLSLGARVYRAELTLDAGWCSGQDVYSWLWGLAIALVALADT